MEKEVFITKEEKQKTESMAQIFAELIVLMIDEKIKDNNEDTNLIKDYK